MKTKPSPDDMRLAAEWLDWLHEQADAADFRNACKQASVPVALARKALRQSGA